MPDVISNKEFAKIDSEKAINLHESTISEDGYQKQVPRPYSEMSQKSRTHWTRTGHTPDVTTSTKRISVHSNAA
jgi:hypothetical protein